jgi:Ca2+-binding RTX toxin-like protein
MRPRSLTLEHRGLGRRAVAGLIAAIALTTAWLSVAVDRADAAVSAAVANSTLTVNGNGANDKITLRLQAGSPGMLQVDVGDDGSPDFNFDRSTFTAIVVNAGNGADTVRIDQANGNFTDEQTSLNGQNGRDTLLGGSAAEQLSGGSGRDFVDGNVGADIGLLGPGDDTFQWDPGDGSDTVEGNGGYDTLLFNGSGGAEKFELLANPANPQRARFTRDLGNIVMDLNKVESVHLNALGGADLFTANDVRGTDVVRANVDLGAALNAAGGDNAADSIVVNGTAGNDYIRVSAYAGVARVSGLKAEVRIADSQLANDQLTINGLAGDDDITAGRRVSALMKILIDGGA